MSKANIYIIRTEFKDIKSGDTSLGFRIYHDDDNPDNYQNAYGNILDEVYEDDLQFLAQVVESADEKIGDMLIDCIDNEQGVFIDDVLHEYAEIEEILKTL